VVSNTTDKRSNNMDLLGFTTLNRGSVFQNPAMLSNQEGMKPLESKKLGALLSPGKLKLQPNIGK
jgi:hypothetical protein